MNTNEIKVLTIGDVMIDRYVYCDIKGISEEAPVPIVLKKNTIDILGGASNVANNIASIGGKSYLLSLTGYNQDSHILKEMLCEKKIVSYVFYNPERTTTIKERIISNNTQMIRIDYEKYEPVTEYYMKVFRDEMSYLLKEINVVIISDYDKGIVYPELITDIRNINPEAHIIVDPKPEHIEYYIGCDVITPNLKEMDSMIGIKNKEDEQEIIKACAKLKELLRCKCVILTMGDKGCYFYFNEYTHYMIKAEKKNICDVCGAGDTFISTFASCVSMKDDYLTACKIANKCSGLVVTKFGTSTLTNEEFSEIYNNEMKMFGLGEK